ncbi:glycosyltransferase family 2 protein [Flavihumibacter fluvii]|uniref:glycosyltransferase family 2 protein n=1 Tax=Flavihumibacter fluvii TaxID=2838157 RepID=UPI001BDE0321|nr:glycosyltransferase family 2 protein [Flavihumibacter fluvii]ULQ50687.1 glycosyltransferase family 2 protein [Flavihumibacter fluvii]
MVVIAKILYWTSLLVIFYTYFGYGVLMAIFAKWRPRKAILANDNDPLPEVTVLIPAFNEAQVLGAKIRNTLELNYPGDLFDVLVITDGSTDGSPDIVRAFPQVKLIHESRRMGKAAAINKAMESITSPIVVLTDANAFIHPDSLRLLVAHYTNERVGAVSGEKRVMVTGMSGAGEKGEGLYWKYESFLKNQDAQVGTLVGAAGELFSYRRRLFQPLEPDTILDDFVISLRICEKGYRVAYEPAAWAIERGSAGIREEQLRKVRIAAGGFQAMKRLRTLMNFKKHPLLTFQYVSHRVLRWTLAPAGMPVLLATNLFLVVIEAHSWYKFTLLCQAIFYSSACFGWLGARNNTKWPLVYIPYYFVFMNWAVFLGWTRFIKGQQSGIWEKSERLEMPTLDKK